MKKLPPGFPTHTKDIDGKQICLGDICTYDFEDNETNFVVVFEDNAFRKKYKRWTKNLERPMLEYGNMAKKMRIKLVFKAATASPFFKILNQK